MRKYRIYIGLAAFICFSFLTIGCERFHKKLSHFLPVKKTECMLCGNGKNSLKSIYGQCQGIAVICLNDWRVVGIQTSEDERTDVDGTSYIWDKEGAYSVEIDQIASRGISLMRYTSESTNILDVEKLSERLCSVCLEEVKEAVHIYGTHTDRREKAICLIEFPSMKLYRIQQSFQYYLLGDYYVQSYCKGNGIDLMVFFAPEKTVSYMPNGWSHL